MKTISVLSFAFLVLVTFESQGQMQKDSIFAKSSKQNSKVSSPGNTIITLSPLQFLVNGNTSWETHEGFGFSAERIFLNGYAGVMLPVYFKKKNAGYYMMPALKIYPTGQGVAKLSFGPQLIIANLEDEIVNAGNEPSYAPPVDVMRRQLGLGLNVGFGATMFDHLYMSFDASAGKMLRDSFADAGFAGVNAKRLPLFISFGINAGYRF